MIPEKEIAVAGTTAKENNLQSRPYQKSAPLSSTNLKHEIGTLLLGLQFPVGQPLSRIGWQLFERLLRQYVDLRVLPQSRTEPPQETIPG